jgi:hypothetical protein
VSEAAEGVEDGSVEGTGKRTLTIGGQGVGSDALGSRAAYRQRLWSVLNMGTKRNLDLRQVDHCGSQLGDDDQVDGPNPYGSIRNGRHWRSGLRYRDVVVLWDLPSSPQPPMKL